MEDKKDLLVPAQPVAKTGFKLAKPYTGIVTIKGRSINLRYATQEELEVLYNLNARWASRIIAPAGYTRKAANIIGKKK